jgi:hypothetical protein
MTGEGCQINIGLTFAACLSTLTIKEKLNRDEERWNDSLV